MKVFCKNDFTKEDFSNIAMIIDDDKIPLEIRKTAIQLLKAYAKNLYCDESQASLRKTSTGGICRWNNNMLISLPLNDGPIESYPINCPIRKLIK